MDLRGLRQARGWSQEDLAERTGLSTRTIQRIESGAAPSAASTRLLAAAFAMTVDELLRSGNGGAGPEPRRPPTPGTTAVRDGLLGFSDFEGRSSRPDYWWFALCVLLVIAAATSISEAFGAAALVVLALPLAAAGARRLHDTGRSGWWQLFALAPFGVVVPAVLLAQPTDDAAAIARLRHDPEAARDAVDRTP